VKVLHVEREPANHEAQGEPEFGGLQRGLPQGRGDRRF
jgi:hypothetical protein